MNATETAAAELLLQDADFPDNYVNMQHPEEALAARVARIARTEPYQAEAEAMLIVEAQTYRFCCEECDPVGMPMSVYDWQCQRCPVNGRIEITDREAALSEALDHLEIHAWDDPRVFDNSDV